MTYPSWLRRRHPSSPLAATPVTESVGAKDWNGATSHALSEMATRALLALSAEGFFGPGDAATIRELAAGEGPFIGIIAEDCQAATEQMGPISLIAEAAIKLLFAIADAEDATDGVDTRAADELVFIGMEIATLSELLTVAQTGLVEDAAGKRALRDAQAAAARETNRKRAAYTARLRQWIIQRAQSILDHGEPPSSGGWAAADLADEVFRDWAPVPGNDQYAEDRLVSKRTSYATVKREVKTAWLNGDLRIPSRSGR